MSARLSIVGAFVCIVAIAVVFVASAHRVVVTHSAPASTDTCRRFAATPGETLDGGMRFVDAGVTVILHPGETCTDARGYDYGVDR